MNKPLAQRLADRLSAVIPGFETTKLIELRQLVAKKKHEIEAHKEANLSALISLQKLASKKHHRQFSTEALALAQDILKKAGVSL